jgi:hypothetical protein
MREEEDR